MELVARYRGIIELAIFSDLAYYAAYLVVLGDGAADGGIGDVGAVSLVQRLEDFFLKLIFVVLYAVGRYLTARL